MKTHPLCDAENRLFAFEVSNLGLSRHGVCRVVRAIPGAMLPRKPRLLSWLREDSFCEFVVDGEKYEAARP